MARGTSLLRRRRGGRGASERGGRRDTERRPPRVSARALDVAERCLHEALKFRYPVDAVVAYQLRGARDLNAAERRLVGEAVFGALRRMRTLGAIAGDGARQLIAAAIVRHPEIGPDALSPLLDEAGREQARAIAAANPPTEPPALAADLPDWLWERLREAVGSEEAREAAAALARPAPLDLRINPLRIERPLALARLQQDGYRAEPCALSPWGIRVRGRPSLRDHPLLRSGALEVQDEGSQLVGLLLDARPGEMVADYCAGAGGKTLLLGAAMQSRGRLYAFDVEAGRLERLGPRLKRSRLSNVMPVVIEPSGDERIRRLAAKLDRVLVDAPCTGVGTVRRNPDLKWKHRPEDVAELAAKQRDILRRAAALLKPGGQLVYATCSWLREENEAVVESFLDAHPGFRQAPVWEVLEPQGVSLEGRPEHLRLWPHRQGTDGFFAARFIRQE